jgi:hypothetical protein
MVPSLDGLSKLTPIISFKVCFVILYILLPSVVTAKFDDFTDLQQANFNLNFLMAILNLGLCIVVSRKFTAFSSERFETQS